MRRGSDIAFLHGIIRYALETRRYHADYVKLHTNAQFIVGEKYGFQDGLFSGFDEKKAEYDKTAWGYQADAQTKAYGVDPTLENPRCVFQLLKKHVDRYTPEMVERICGTPKAQFLKVAEVVTSTGNAEKVGTILYALGWTQHSIGVQIIRAAAMLQLLLGNVGRPGGGVNALRGHSNIQGATDMGGTFDILPGYLKTPNGTLTDLATYLEKCTPWTLNKMAWASMNYWTNYPKFMVSLLKSVWGKTATKENEFGYAWLPKVDGNYSWAYMFDDMYRGNSMRPGARSPGPEGLISFGMNPVGTGPNSLKMVAALSKLKWLVMVENQETETAAFWKAPTELQGPDASKIQTEVYLLPATNFAEKDGTFTNSARWVQWKWKAVDGPGSPRATREIIARMFLAVRDLYHKERGALPGAGAQHLLVVHQPGQSRPRRGAEGDQRKGDHRSDRATEGSEVQGPAEGPQDRRAAARRIRPARRTTAARSAATGCTPASSPRAGNNSARRHTTDPIGLGKFHQWAFSWPANRRVMYNRASADAPGKPWESEARRHPVERREVGGGRPGHQARLTARTVRRLHHAARGRGTPLRAGPQRRSLPRALRAGGGAGGERPPSEGEQRARS